MSLREWWSKADRLKRQLVVVEIVYYILDAIVLVLYFAYPNNAYLIVGLLFTLSFFISIWSTVLWLKRTD